MPQFFRCGITAATSVRELLLGRAVAILKNSFSGDPVMLELAAIVAVSAIALTFVTDATSGTMKVARAMSRRKDKIRVADHH